MEQELFTLALDPLGAPIPSAFERVATIDTGDKTDTTSPKNGMSSRERSKVEYIVEYYIRQTAFEPSELLGILTEACRLFSGE